MYIIYVHCNFICGLTDVIIKIFSQSVSGALQVSPPATNARASGQGWGLRIRLKLGPCFDAVGWAAGRASGL